MPFVLPFLPAIIGATGAIGGALIGKSAASKSQSLQKTLQDQAMKDAATRDKMVGTTSGTLDQYLNPPGGNVRNTPFYQSLLSSATNSTATAYKNAQANQLQRANMAGYGYTSPISQGGTNALKSEEASQLAQAPNTAALQTADKQMQAATLRTGQAGLYNPQAYFTSQVPLAQGQDQQAQQFGTGLGSIFAQLAKVISGKSKTAPTTPAADIYTDPSPASYASTYYGGNPYE